MKYFVTGVGGQLGFDIVRELKSRGITDVVAPTKEELDITNREAVLSFFERVRPDVVFHCAAYTAVDAAEDNEDLCYSINVEGTKNIVDASIMSHAKIFFMSTDYVFDGKKIGEYTEEDSTNAKSVYGKSKELGEEIVRENLKHFIIRISWVFGSNGNNFVKTMLKLGREKSEINVVDDQIGSPTYTRDLAKVLVDMSDSDYYGIYNITNSDYCSWAEFSEAIFEEVGYNVKVNHIKSKDYKQKAYRPLNSKLSKDKLERYFYLLPSWRDALKRYLEEIK